MASSHLIGMWSEQLHEKKLCHQQANHNYMIMGNVGSNFQIKHSEPQSRYNYGLRVSTGWKCIPGDNDRHHTISDYSFINMRCRRIHVYPSSKNNHFNYQVSLFRMIIISGKNRKPCPGTNSSYN